MHRVKPFLSLIRKEWRDARALTIACALLVPIALVAMNEGFLDWRGDVGAWFVPVVTILYAAVVASDLIAADVASGRAGSYAGLPVRASTLWTSKLAFLVLAAGGFLAWTLAVTCGLHELRATPDALDAFWRDLAGNDWRVAILAGVALVSAVVLWSTVLERGIAVIGAALVTCAAIGGVVPLIAWYDRELLPDPTATMIAVCALPVVFLAGSLVGFVRAPLHASSLLRRLAVAVALPAALLVPAGAVSAAVLSDRLDVELGDPEVRIAAGHVSPDGRYLALLGAKSHRHARVRTWILDLEDGSVAALPQRGLQADWESPWTDDGHYVAWTEKDSGLDLRREYDPKTGKILRTRSQDQVYASRSSPYSEWARLRREGGEVVITMDGADHELRVPTRHWPRCARIPGFVLVQDARGVHVHDLTTGTDRLLVPARKDERVSAFLSPGGEYVHLYRDARQEICETRTGRRVAVPDGVYVSWMGRSSSDHLALGYRKSSTMPLVVDLRTGDEADFPGLAAELLSDAADFIALDPDTVFVVRRSGRVLRQSRGDARPRTVFDPRR